MSPSALRNAAALRFVRSENERRRHLEKGQRADDQRKMYAAAWQRANKNPGGKGTAKNRGVATDCNLAESSESAHAAAEKFGVSTRGVYQAAVVIDHGCPQLQQAVRDGRVNVTLAERVPGVAPRARGQARTTTIVVKTPTTPPDALGANLRGCPITAI